MKKRLITAACVLFWLALWQVGAILLDQKILLVSPIEAAARLIELVPSADFWGSVWFSAGRILCGFALGLFSGTALALLAGKLRFVKTLLSPLVSAVKAVPVASICPHSADDKHEHLNSLPTNIWLLSSDTKLRIKFLC